MPESVTIRPEVQEFAMAMERTLRRHDGEKDGWEDMPIKDCLERAYGEMYELWKAVGRNEHEADTDKVQGEAIDAANFLLFLWHNAPDRCQDPEGGEG